MKRELPKLYFWRFCEVRQLLRYLGVPDPFDGFGEVVARHLRALHGDFRI